MNTTDFVQGSKEWLEMRKNHIMASDAPVIMGVSRYKTSLLMLWEEKLGVGKKKKDNVAMKYGRDTEGEARDCYNRYVGTDTKPRVIFHPNIPFMGASLDGLSEDETRAVEIKCVNRELHQMAKDGVCPECFCPQLQHQLACLGLDSMDYFSYQKGGDFALVEVRKDEDYLESLYEAEEAFWCKVLNLESPELSDMDYVGMESSLDWAEASQGWLDVSEKIKALEGLEKAYRSSLIKLSDGQSSKGSGITLSKSLRKGSIEYRNIPELEGINLEPFRKKPLEIWTIRKDNKF